MSIQYKVEENQLTTPPSHSIRFVPRGSAGREEIAVLGLRDVLRPDGIGNNLAFDRSAVQIRTSYSGRVVDIPKVQTA